MQAQIWQWIILFFYVRNLSKIKKLFYGGKCISTLDNNNEYVIVGGGMVAGYTVNGIRKKDMNGSIFVVSKDADVP